MKPTVVVDWKLVPMRPEEIRTQIVGGMLPADVERITSDTLGALQCLRDVVADPATQPYKGFTAVSEIETALRAGLLELGVPADVIDPRAMEIFLSYDDEQMDPLIDMFSLKGDELCMYEPTDLIPTCVICNYIIFDIRPAYMLIQRLAGDEEQVIHETLQVLHVFMECEHNALRVEYWKESLLRGLELYGIIRPLALLRAKGLTVSEADRSRIMYLV
jgi:hypothetical protein